MKRLLTLAMIPLILLGCSKPVAVTHKRPPDTRPFDKNTDYQKHADSLEWNWDGGQASLFYCVRHELRDHQSEIICPKEQPSESLKSFRERSLVKLRILDDGKEVVALDVYGWTVFTRRGTVLFIAEFSPISTGCSVRAFDFKSKVDIWKTDLRGIGPVSHSAYHNQVTIGNTSGEAIVVTGNESAGKYIEYLDSKTGKTVGHKVFRDE